MRRSSAALHNTIMLIRRHLAYLGLTAAMLAPVRAEEHNAWPVRVVQTDPAGQATSTGWAGPLFFEKPNAAGGHDAGFRPFYIEHTDATGRRTEISCLYPLFTYRADSDAYVWSVFNLVNRYGRAKGSAPELAKVNHDRFDIWPFYFSRNTGDPATSHRGLFPIFGDVKGFMGYDRFAWVLLPLYAEVDKRGYHTTLAPWPFLRVTTGAEKGFEARGVLEDEQCLR